MKNKKVSVTALAVVAVLLAGCVPSWAGLPEVEAKLDSERVALTLKAAPAKKFFALYEDLLGVEVQYQCPEERNISLGVENVTVRTSLNAACESANLRWTLEEGSPAVLRIACGEKPPDTGERRVFKIITKEKDGKPAECDDDLPPPPGEPGKSYVRVKAIREDGDQGAQVVRVTVNLKDADVLNTMKMAAQLLDAKLLVDHALSGKTVTMNLKEVNVNAFLDEACRQAGATWRLKDGNPPVLEINKAE